MKISQWKSMKIIENHWKSMQANESSSSSSSRSNSSSSSSSKRSSSQPQQPAPAAAASTAVASAAATAASTSSSCISSSSNKECWTMGGTNEETLWISIGINEHQWKQWRSIEYHEPLQTSKWVMAPTSKQTSNQPSKQGTETHSLATLNTKTLFGFYSREGCPR